MEIEKIVLNLTQMCCFIVSKMSSSASKSSKRLVKSVYENPDARCDVRRSQFAPEIIAPNVSSSVFKVASLSSSATFREQ